MKEELRIGDSANVGPFYGKYADESPINLTNAAIWLSVAATRGGTPLFTRKNAKGGGSDEQVFVGVADANLGGPVWAYFITGDTEHLVNGTTYYYDARATLEDGNVHTLGEGSFRAVTAYTLVPVPV